MKCSICSKNEAYLCFKQVINGVSKKIYLCEECAETAQAELSPVMSGADVSCDIQTGPGLFMNQSEKTCSKCGLKESEFHRYSRLGCPECYNVFATILEPIMESVHAGMKHAGKIPYGEKRNRKIDSLKKAMSSAVAKQDFEEAAALRDRITSLEKSTGAREGRGGRDNDN